jgi:hypothetical protein
MKPDGIRELYEAVNIDPDMLDEDLRRTRVQEALGLFERIFDHTAQTMPPLEFRRPKPEEERDGEGSHVNYEVLPAAVARVEFDGNGQSGNNQFLFLVRTKSDIGDPPAGKEMGCSLLIGPIEVLDPQLAEATANLLFTGRRQPHYPLTQVFSFSLDGKGDYALWVADDTGFYPSGIEPRTIGETTTGLERLVELGRRVAQDRGMAEAAPLATG